jgi:hypothetical protein
MSPVARGRRAAPSRGGPGYSVTARSRRSRNPTGIRRGGTLPADHAGSVLCRLLMDHPEVAGIELLGQSELIEGTITYSLGVYLPDGRELSIDVEDAAPRHRKRSG